MQTWHFFVFESTWPILRQLPLNYHVRSGMQAAAGSLGRVWMVLGLNYSSKQVGVASVWQRQKLDFHSIWLICIWQTKQTLSCLFTSYLVSREKKQVCATLYWIYNYYRLDSSTCIVSSSSPGIFCRSNESTFSTTRSNLAYVVRWLECGPPGSNDDAEGANWMWIDPIRLVASFGQNRGAV